MPPHTGEGWQELVAPHAKRIAQIDALELLAEPYAGTSALSDSIDGNKAHYTATPTKQERLAQLLP